MPILNVNNTKFYYELHGKGQPLVLISGLKGDHTRWLAVLDKLAKKYQVLILDNRGVGQTIDQNEAFDVGTMADDVMQIIKHLKLNKAHIVGHSLGGAIAQVIANKYSDYISSIALCNTFIKFNDTGRKVFSEVLKLHQDNASQADIMESLIPWLFSPKFINSDLISLIRKMSNENPYPQSLSGYSRQLQALYDFDSSAWINSINVPTIVLGSDFDRVATLDESREIARCIINSKLVNLPTGHASQIEKPDSFIEVLDGFLQDIDINANN